MRLELEIPSQGIADYLSDRAHAHGRSVEDEALAALEELWIASKRDHLARLIVKPSQADNWDSTFAVMDAATEDSFPEREQPAYEIRNRLEHLTIKPPQGKNWEAAFAAIDALEEGAMPPRE